MTRETPTTWLNKLKSQLSHKLSRRKASMGILAFEIAGLMSKLLLLHQSLSDKSIIRLKNESISFEGIRKLISNDDSFLLSLAAAELLQNLHLSAKSTSRLSRRCEDPKLRSFHNLFDDFTDRGRDPYNWVLNGKELDSLIRKAEKKIAATSSLYKEMEELGLLEKKNYHQINGEKFENSVKVQKKIGWQRQEVKILKDKSLWNRSFDSVVVILAKLIFSLLARIKMVFGIGHGYIAALPRSLSTSSAMVYPNREEDLCDSAGHFVSGPLKLQKFDDGKKRDLAAAFFESNAKVLKAPPSALGATGLALHDANLIIVLERMVRTPHLIGLDARDDLYSMLPRSIRCLLRERLRGVGFSAADPVLAGEWKDAVGRILGWLSPLAHNMIKWQSERSFEQQNLMMPKTNVLLLQTLYFANRDKTEAAITELLVGLNYIWRFEREMNAKALFECCDFKGLLNLQN